MQTFLPYPDFQKSASVLDNRRLSKQRVEALQILNTLTGKSKGWAHHPAVQQWKGYEGALSYYGWIMCVEWINRGFKSTIHEKFCPFLYKELPPWLGNEKYHSAMRANLLRKDPIWYGKFGWVEDPATPYFWPSKEDIMGKPVAIWNCQLKKRYQNKKEASEAADYVFIKHNDYVDVYHCDLCFGWHLTSKKER